MDKLLDLFDQVDEPQPDELTESLESWQAWLDGKDQGEALEQVRRELLHE